MKAKIVKSLLMLFAVGTLVAGCSTANQGAMGNDTQYGSGAAASGANGSVGPGNPSGLGGGSGAN